MSLNDGWFEYVLNGTTINDQPAINHGFSSSFSFADGHCQLHKWQDVLRQYQKILINRERIHDGSHNMALTNNDDEAA